MRTSLFFILLFNILQIVSTERYCNGTEESDDSCPLSFFRRKRAHIEYNRWRAKSSPTSEQFIVKIPDEEITPATQSVKGVMAVNILPPALVTERIVVGGAMIPPRTPRSTLSSPKDYTRFRPPADGPITSIEGLMMPDAPTAPTSQFGVDLYNPTTLSDLIQLRHPMRDESPPASPQFLPRTAIIPARQFAPITQVAFSPAEETLPPITPGYRMRANDNVVTKTTSMYETAPSRTPTMEIGLFDDIDLIPDSRVRDYVLSRTTPKNVAHPVTPIMDNIDDVEDRKPHFRLIEDTKNYFDNNVDNHDIHIESTTFIGGEYDDDRGTKFTTDDLDNHTENKDKINYVEVTDGTNITDMRYSDYSDGETDNITIHDIEYGVHSGGDKKTSAFEHERRTRKACSLLKLRPIGFNSPRTLPEIVQQMKNWAETSPLAKWVDITEGNLTTMENPIYMMIIDDPSSGQIVTAKKTVMIVAGIQGRDQHAVAGALYVMYQLIEHSETHSDLLQRYRFWIIPVLNPDGYAYAITFPDRRNWSKNLKQTWEVCKGREYCRMCERAGLRCTVQPCFGVNLDRNFEYQWIPNEQLRAEHPCGELFAGTRQLSELETRAFTHYMHKQRTPVHMFIAFKEGDILGVMYPYSHTRKKRAYDHVYRQRASRAASAAYSISGRPYVAGQTSEFLPLFAGGIEDWVDGHLGVGNTFTVMMYRPTDNYNPKLAMERVVHEAYAAMDTLLLQNLLEPERPPGVMKMDTKRRLWKKSFAHIILPAPLVVATAALLSYTSFIT